LNRIGSSPFSKFVTTEDGLFHEHTGDLSIGQQYPLLRRMQKIICWEERIQPSYEACQGSFSQRHHLLPSYMLQDVSKTGVAPHPRW
jgi:hypothetical protein